MIITDIERHFASNILHITKVLGEATSYPDIKVTGSRLPLNLNDSSLQCRFSSWDCLKLFYSDVYPSLIS